MPAPQWSPVSLVVMRRSASKRPRRAMRWRGRWQASISIRCWATDSNGNYTSNLVMPGSGTNASLEAIETSFHQDLNGDGTIGVPTTVIESSGSSSLVQGGSNDFFNPGPGIIGTELKYAGAAVVAGQFGGYAPLGVEATATGYEVAWKVAGVDQYSVRATDSNGNYTSNLVMPGSGTNASLEAIEDELPPGFEWRWHHRCTDHRHRVVGLSSLVQGGSNYFFKPRAGITGTELKYAGAAVVAGQFGGYAPLGVEATMTGYEVAWKVAGVDQYSVWATDNNGNYTSNLVMSGSGTNASLEAIERHSSTRDLNGDGTIGIHAATLAAPVVIASNDAFHFNSSMVADAGPATADSGGFLVRPASELEAVLADQVASFQWANDATIQSMAILMILRSR